MSDDLLCWNHRHCHLWEANNIYVMIRKHWARHGQGLLGIQRQEWGVNQSVWSTGDNRRPVQHNMSQSQAQASHNEDKKLALSYHDHQTISELSSQQNWVLRLGGFWIIEVLLDLPIYQKLPKPKLSLFKRLNILFKKEFYLSSKKSLSVTFSVCFLDVVTNSQRTWLNCRAKI